MLRKIFLVLGIIFLAGLLLVILLFLLARPLMRYLSKPANLAEAKERGLALARTKGKTIAVVVGHPDDTDWYTGGTLAKLHLSGNRIVVVVGTSGEKGGNNTPELGKVREAEQLKAAQILGYDRVIFLRHPDRQLEPNAKFKDEIGKIFKEEKPEILFTFDVEREGYIYRHSDHRAAGLAALEVAKRFKGIKQLYLFHSSTPNTIFEINDVLDQKAKAMAAHQSQGNNRMGRLFSFIPRFLRPDLSRGFNRGFNVSYPSVGIKSAEVFRSAKRR